MVILCAVKELSCLKGIKLDKDEGCSAIELVGDDTTIPRMKRVGRVKGATR